MRTVDAPGSGDSGQEASVAEGLLKQRVAELEGTLAREAARFQRAAAEHDTLTAQLLTARRNNEILGGNIEALKALATQLATQLEDARLELATERDAAAAADMRLRRDAASELVATERKYEAELDMLRATLSEQQELVTRMRDSNTDADVRSEVAVAKVAVMKDLIIDELRREMDVLKLRLDKALEPHCCSQPRHSSRARPSQSARGASPQSVINRHRTPPVRASAADISGAASRTAGRALLLPSQAAGLHRSAVTAWDTDVESEVSAANRAIVDVKVCVSKEDFLRTKWGIASRSTSRLPGASATRFHIDVTTDGTFVDAIPFRELPPPTPSSCVAANPGEELFRLLAMGGAQAPARFAAPTTSVADTAARERCAFLTASGEEIRITVEIVPLATRGV